MTTRARRIGRRFFGSATVGVAALFMMSACRTGALESPSPTGSASPTLAASMVMASPTASPVPTPAVTVEPAAPTPTNSPAAAGAPILDLLAEVPPGFVSTITCEGDIGESDPVAIVRLPASDSAEPAALVLRNYADAAQPRNSCTFGPGDYWIHSLIDARHVLITGQGEDYALVDLPEVRYHWFRLPVSDESYASLIAVSPDLDAVTWRRAFTDDSLRRQILMTDASGEHLLTDLPRIETGRCGSPLDSSEGGFARTSDSFYVLDQPYAGMNVLVAGRGSDVALTLVPPDTGWEEAAVPLMALWSPTSDTLYYRVGDDVMRWSVGSVPEPFLPDTPWSHPTFTPDGRHLAYATEEGIYLVDMTRAPAPELIRADGITPVFLSSSQLWFKVSPQQGCVTDETQVRVYDLNDRFDAASIIDGVLAVWPATSSSSR